MSQDDAAEKSHEATPHKLEQARKKGEVPRSNDLTAAASYLGLLVAVFALAGPGTSSFAHAMAKFFEFPDAMTAAAIGSGHESFALDLMLQTVIFCLLAIGLPAALVLVGITAQRGWVFAPEKITPKLSRISPIAGLKNKFGLNGIVEFAKSSFKLLFVSVLLIWFCLRHFDVLMSSGAGNAQQMTLLLTRLLIEFLLIVFLMTFAIGGVDYLWQVRSHLKKNMMSRKELEDETKSNDGDPHHKQTRRQRGYEIAMNQMLADVPKADVILVNPTHYAVALQWNRASKGAPVCVAKGTDAIAAKIREIATASQIPIHSDPPTTRAVFATVDIGQQVLPEHYEAVAIAIRFAEKMRKRAVFQ